MGAFWAALWTGQPTGLAAEADALEAGFDNPPVDARLRAYWWWLNGNVTRESITRDLEEMKAKGFGGALICDAGGAEQDGNRRVPHGPTFFTPEWRELYKHALREGARLGLTMSLNIQSGWNLGGPMIQPSEAPKKLVWSETRAAGPAAFESVLAAPRHAREFYEDVAVVAYRVRTPRRDRRPMADWPFKAVYRSLGGSAPETSQLLRHLPDEPGEADALSNEVVDLTGRMDGEGKLTWDAPAGEWNILRFGCTLNDHCRVSTCSDGWQGYAIDPLDAGVFRSYWNKVVEPLIADAGPLAGRTLKYLHTDSWEVEAYNWTPGFREAFQAHRGYDPLPFLPVMAGHIVDSRGLSTRFMNDYRKTLGDLAIDHHYKLFVEGAHRHGLLIHPESGGPHAVPIDAQRCLGMDDMPMSEFWAWSWRHRVGDVNRFFVKQPASAAHTTGKSLVAAEGFTTIGPHWQETLWDNLKPSFDRAACEGFNQLFWHAFVCSPREMGLPGQQYFAGTHLNPNSRWWGKSAAFFAYLNRCQFLLRQGEFVADACYYYGDYAPNFAQLKRSDPARVMPGFDYDVVTEETVVTRMSVRDGRIVLPGGMSYRLLALPDQQNISLPVLRKVRELVEAGATVVGPRPVESESLRDYPDCDREVSRLAGELWGASGDADSMTRRVGAGRVISGHTGREVLRADGVKPDFEFHGDALTTLDYIHRRDGGTEIYFLANASNRWEEAQCTFRVSGKAPELWNPVTGERRFARAYRQAEGCTTLPMEFTPYGSWLVVFRSPASEHPGGADRNSPRPTERGGIDGAWTVHFDPKWGGPETVQFDRLTSWTKRPEDGIRFYSGTAVYRQTFDLPSSLRSSEHAIILDLGEVRQLAQVRLNGRDLGVLWTFPFRVDITKAVKAEENELEIEVVNFWPNRIIGDHSLPEEKRYTRTNITKLTRDTPLVESGLLGPVRFLVEQ